MLSTSGIASFMFTSVLVFSAPAARGLPSPIYSTAVNTTNNIRL
jgi:hypothetical protein